MLSVTSSPSLVSCWFSGNSACLRGGGLYCRSSDAILINCTFTGNSVTTLALGGGMANDVGNATLMGCVFVGNQAVSGGGFYNEYAIAKLTNCTFADNSASNGKAIACYAEGGVGHLDAFNCILWDGGEEVEVWDNTSAVTITYSDIQGGWSGSGNLDDDPLFADPVGGDFHLAADSPCIDSGDPGVAQRPGDLDFDGQLRVWDGDDDGTAVIDMGADEFGSPCPGDLDLDGDIDLADLAQLLASYGATGGATYEDGDLDFDGDVDLSDLAILLSNYGLSC